MMFRKLPTESVRTRTIERLTKYFLLIHQHLLHFRFESALYPEYFSKTYLSDSPGIIESFRLSHHRCIFKSKDA
jgi:hypothetical protein